MSSDESTAALDEAVRAYIAANRPTDHVAAWVMVAATVLADNDDANGYVHETAPGQAVYTTLGLIDMAREHLHANLRRHDDDD